MVEGKRGRTKEMSYARKPVEPERRMLVKNMKANSVLGEFTKIQNCKLLTCGFVVCGSMQTPPNVP